MRPPSLALPLFLVATACGHSAEPRQIVAVDADLRPVVDGSNAFTWDMLRTAVALDAGNVFLSPFSVVTAVSMVYGGANGETEAQIASAMSVPDGGEDTWHENLGALVADLSGEHYRPYTLYTANRVWVQTGYPVLADYQTLLEDTYLAPFERSDFEADPAAARDEINAWVAEQTHDRIPKLFEAGDISDATRLALVNAIYFLADWKVGFDPDETASRAFRLASGDELHVPTMSVEGTFGTGVTAGGVTVLRMAYESGEVSMIVLLPEADDGADALAAGLDSATVGGMLDVLEKSKHVEVTMPSFELSYELPLKDALVSLGIVDLFDPELADLSGIVDPSNDHLSVEAARHKAFIRVDEEGTEAAAATGMEAGSVGVPPTPTVVHVDHPFVFLIRDDLTGTVLFAGRIADPSKAPISD
jgi:serpin B